MLSRYQLQCLALSSKFYVDADMLEKSEIQNYIDGFEEGLRRTGLDEESQEKVRDKSVKYQMYKLVIDRTELFAPFEY